MGIILDTPPLCVDLDGTLIRSDLLLESIALLLKLRPFDTVLLPVWFLRGGRAGLKRKLAERVQIDPSILPYHEEFLQWIKEERKIGRKIILATASDTRLAQLVASHLGIFDGVLGSDGFKNVKGAAKSALLVHEFAGGFDYAGDSPADLPVWSSCRKAIVVNGSPGLLRKIRERAQVARVFDTKPAGFRTYAKALRIHQWVKNLLIFVPLITSHQITNPDLLRTACLAFLSFSFCASAVYLINEIVDLESDRHHPTKKSRPFASGELPIIVGFLLAPVLFVVSFGFALFLSASFQLVLLCYAALTFAYSLALKRIVLVDVFTLATLYTIRLVAGHAAYHVVLSTWLLSFSMFLFLSLGFCKRTSELFHARKQQRSSPPGRGYQVSDLEQTNLFGAASGFLASLVFTLYMQSDNVVLLYQSPQILWLLFPVLLYWISRIWILTHRGEMNEDPVAFAIKDRVTWIVAALGGFFMLAATRSWTF